MKTKSERRKPAARAVKPKARQKPARVRVARRSARATLPRKQVSISLLDRVIRLACELEPRSGTWDASRLKELERALEFTPPSDLVEAWAALGDTEPRLSRWDAESFAPEGMLRATGELGELYSEDTYVALCNLGERGMYLCLEPSLVTLLRTPAWKRAHVLGLTKVIAIRFSDEASPTPTGSPILLAEWLAGRFLTEEQIERSLHPTLLALLQARAP